MYVTFFAFHCFYMYVCLYVTVHIKVLMANATNCTSNIWQLVFVFIVGFYRILL